MKSTPRVLTHLSSSLIFLLVITGLSSVMAQPADRPLEDFVTTDGIVYAITKTNDVLYFGGSFTSVGLRSGGGVPVSSTTGQPEAVYPKVNGTVSSAISDGQGGWFLGGNFTVVGGLPRTNIVHIRIDRSVDAAWHPAVIGGYAGSLILSGNTLYIGGFFTNVNGQVRNRLAALDATTGALLNWNPDASAEVRALVLGGNTLYAGGAFTTVGGLTRNRIVALDGATGLPTSWNPGADDRVEALAVSGGRLFAGGYFTTIASQSRSRVASFELAGGTLEAWNPGAGTITIVSPTVFKIAVQQNTVFIAGSFSTMGGSNRVSIAAVDATTGATTEWDAHGDYVLSGSLPTASIQGLAIHNNTVYVGGILGNTGGQPRKYAAALDATTALATAWNPDPNGVVGAFFASGNSVYVGGVFSALGGAARTNCAAYNLTTRQILPWNPTANNNVWTLLVHSNAVFVGGEFNLINGVTRSNLALVDASTGSLLPWNPSPNLYVLGLARWNNRLYVGGGFTNISGGGRTNIAEFDLTTGNLTAWSPVLNRAQVRVLTVHSNLLFAGGLISSVNGVTRRRLAAFDLTTGGLSSWNPDINSTGAGIVETIAAFGDRVYVGGRFALVGGLPRTNLFAADFNTGQVLPWVAHANMPVVALAASSNLVFAGGDFGTIGGVSRRYLAALDATTAAVTEWNPNPDFFIRKMMIADGLLYPCGFFMRISGETTRGLAAFSLNNVPPPVIDSASLVRLGDGRFQFQFSAPGASQATVWGSTNLSAWENLQAVPVMGNSAQFIDNAAPAHPHRFYKVSVP